MLVYGIDLRFGRLGDYNIPPSPQLGWLHYCFGGPYV